jgi:NAD-dependent dihydropyrimidine dehydrogenase PreA subunit
MKVDDDICVGCESCLPYCPVAAISMEDVAVIDQDECVECSVCLKSKVCPEDAFIPEQHPWPRSVRAVFSNPAVEHKETRVAGRGTEEMKTNDVTGMYQRGFVGITAELGRPYVGARFRDAEKVAKAMAKAGVTFAPDNPLTHLIVDKTTGKLDPEVLNEKVLTCMVECLVPIENIPAVLKELKEIAPQLNTVFSLDIISRLNPDGSVPYEKVLEENGVKPSLNGKLNLGLGRPLAEEVQS